MSEKPSCIIEGQVYRSRQNGLVFSTEGISPCLCVGNHSGVEPKIIVYERRKGEAV